MGEGPLVELVAVMRQLRRDCAWKRGQTHQSLVRYLLEETHETVEAIETGDMALLREELGDVLLQIYFHAVIAEERDEFTLDEVAADLIAKLRRRNPHVFAEGGATDPVAINEEWERIKTLEKRRSHPEDGLPASLPTLLYAQKAVDRLERAGLDLPDPTDDDVGARLLALVIDAHRQGIDADQALRTTVRDLLRR